MLSYRLSDGKAVQPVSWRSSTGTRKYATITVSIELKPGASALMYCDNGHKVKAWEEGRTGGFTVGRGWEV